MIDATEANILARQVANRLSMQATAWANGYIKEIIAPMIDAAVKDGKFELTATVRAPDNAHINELIASLRSFGYTVRTTHPGSIPLLGHPPTMLAGIDKFVIEWKSPSKVALLRA